MKRKAISDIAFYIVDGIYYDEYDEAGDVELDWLDDCCSPRGNG